MSSKKPIWKKAAPRVVLPPNKVVPDKKKKGDKEACRKPVNTDE